MRIGTGQKYRPEESSRSIGTVLHNPALQMKKIVNITMPEIVIRRIEKSDHR